MRRTWIKLFVDQCLRGSMIDELANEERWSWFGLLLLAGDNPIEGEVGITNEIGYTDDQVAKILDVPLEIFQRAKVKMVEFGKIEVTPGGIISICNWKKYQSEYLRQRRYRKGYQSKLQRKVTSEGAPESDQEKKKKRKKGEGRREKEIKTPPQDPIDVSAKKPPHVADPRIKVLIDYHFENFGKHFPGKRYRVEGKKDGNHIRELLETHSEGEIKRTDDKMFVSSDPFIKGSGYTVGVLYACFNKLQLEGAATAAEVEDPQTAARNRRALEESRALDAILERRRREESSKTQGGMDGDSGGWPGTQEHTDGATKDSPQAADGGTDRQGSPEAEGDSVPSVPLIPGEIRPGDTRGTGGFQAAGVSPLLKRLAGGAKGS